MTIGQHVAAMRLLMKSKSHMIESTWEDDSIYTEQSIYHFLKMANSEIIRQDDDKNKKHSFDSYRGFCVEMERGLLTDCGNCIDTGCEVLRTKVQIPKSLTSKRRDILRVYTVDRKEIGRITTDLATAQLDPVLADELLYDIVDSRIVIYNGSPSQIIPRYIYVEAIWEDITDWTGIAACSTGDDEEQPSGSCFDIENDSMPMATSNSLRVYDMALRLMGFYQGRPVPMHPDTNERAPH